MSVLAIIGVLGGMLGATFVAFGKPDHANVTWVIANPCLILHNFLIGESEQMLMYVYYVSVALIGISLMIRRRLNNAKTTSIREAE